MMKKYSVAIIENDKGQVLLLRRSWSAPWQDYKWSLPGGTIEEGEEPIDALVREIKEEMGIDIDSSECVHCLTLNENDKKRKHQTFYYKIHCDDFSEESIVLNFENDKYQFVDKDSAKDEELIPNLDVVFDHLIESEIYKPEDIKKINIEKGFDDLLQQNPFHSNFLEKASLNKTKLVLKEITDKIGRHMKKWVKEDQAQSTKKESVQSDSEDQPSDYNSVHNDESKLRAHASLTPTAQLHQFIMNEGKNPKASKLIAIAQKEIDKREGKVSVKADEKKKPTTSAAPKAESDEEYAKRSGKKVAIPAAKVNKTSSQAVESEEDYNKRMAANKKPIERLTKFVEQEKSNPESSKSVERVRQELENIGVKTTKPKEEKKVDHAQAHLDLASIADTSKDLTDYIKHIDRDKNLSKVEKEKVKDKIYTQIGKLTHKEAKQEKVVKPKKTIEKSTVTDINMSNELENLIFGK